jgi:AmmeMemoRadiSam system protein A
MHSLSDNDRKNILDLARQAVVEAVSRQRLLEEIPQIELFQQKCGVFVTLHVHGKLRGCIGVIESKEPLGQEIVRCAASAALDDPRFHPMEPDELPALDIEVSLLSPLRRIRPEQIEIGRHGLLVQQGVRRGLLLPQVAVEHKLSSEDFLMETCHKAGLQMNAWKAPDTIIYGFTCEIVEQKKPAP